MSGPRGGRGAEAAAGVAMAIEHSEKGRIAATASWRRRATFPAAIAVANVFIFLFQIMVARITTPAVFGQVVALLGIMLLIEAPASTLQVLLSRAVQDRAASSSEGNLGLDLGSLVAVALVAGLVLTGILIPVSVGLGGYLHLEETPYLIAIYALPVMVSIVPRGVLAGIGNYKALSVGLVTSAGIRLGAGTALLHTGHGVNGALAAVVAGELVASAIMLVAAKRHTDPNATSLQFAWRDGIKAGMPFTGFWLLTGIDVVVARHYLTGGSAGQYAAGATLAQLVMIFPGAAAALVAPRFFGRRARSRRAAATLINTVLATVAASLLVGGVVEILTRQLIDSLFGPGYHLSFEVTALLLFAAGCLGCVTVLQQYLAARRELLPAALPWLGTASFVTLAAISHSSMSSVATDLAVATAGTGVVMLLVAIHGYRYILRSGAPATPSLEDLDADLDLTVVVPYYNPGRTLAPNLRRLLDVLDLSPVDYEVIAVSDGSTDGSEATIADLDHSRLRCVILPHNQGKGAALRVGLAIGRGRYLGFIDADGDLDPKLLEAFLTLVSLYQPDLVVGSKRHPLSEVHYPPLRRVYSVGFQYLIRLMFRLKVRDTQTGLKLIRRDVLAASLPRMLEKRFAFDLELLVVAHRLGYRRIFEAPIVLQHQFTSTVSIRSVGNTLLDTFAIFYRLRFIRTYDRRTDLIQEQDVRLSPAFVRGLSGRR